MSEIRSITSGHKNLFCYAEGRRIKLTLVPECFFIETIKDDSSGIAKKIASRGTVLLGGATLIPKASLAAKEWKHLKKLGVVRAVYCFDNGVKAVPLPEIKLFYVAKEQAEVIEVLKNSPIPFEITKEENYQLTLHPKSDRGEDALALANYIYERGIKAIASVRVIHVMTPGARK